jgi:SAM-dependent MidA family methyltransferase
MEAALYGPSGFFTSGAFPSSAGPAGHFRTSVHASPLFAGAIGTLLSRVDSALGHPSTVDVVDVGAGRGELLMSILDGAAEPLRSRLRLNAVELAPRPDGLPAAIGWRSSLPVPVTGLLIATEWLDNVPVDVVERGADGTDRYLLTDGSTGEPVCAQDQAWLDRWWPLPPGCRAEIGRPRDEAWQTAVSTVERGLALTVDYGHFRDDRPALGTLTGYRDGRQVPPVPDGSCDLTAHVAFDALATPGCAILRQRDALAALGVSGTRPPLDRASTDPAGYLRALSSASAAAELTDPAGLGGHLWLLRPVGIPFRL